MEVEMEVLHQNGTWDLVPLSLGAKNVGCKWVYMMKFNPDGSLDHFECMVSC